MHATAVIGANFGDEGKGLMVDYFARPGGVVVRHNGGAQAGHTVCDPAGRRHIFHHFGAGTFRGAGTFLSRYFVVNPLLWRKERDELGTAIGLAIHPDAMLTTPYDMLLNQAAEAARGDGRHGSCGVGVNETYHRRDYHPTTITDMAFPVRGVFANQLDLIRREYVPERIRQLGIVPGEQFWRRVNDDGILATYLSACVEMIGAGLVLADHKHIGGVAPIVFEGGQGLLLGEGHRFFPYVTRGHPGLRNVVEICKEAGIEKIGAVYVTRPYMTRHGPGPFPSEDTALVYRDDTNILNEYQGALRFGLLDFNLMAESIHHDLESVDGVAVDPCIAVTHLDQINTPGEIVNAVESATELPVRYRGYGPNRNDVRTRLVR